MNYECLTVIQVEDEQSDMDYYTYYIYTNDAALAAGKELIGAPKKFAKIGLIKEYDVIMGYLGRLVGKRLVTFVMKLNTRAAGTLIDFILLKLTYLCSVRHLSPIGGRSGMVFSW